MDNKVTMWGKSNTQGHHFPLNLQHFAEGADEPTTEGGDQLGAEPKAPTMYTQDELDARVQSEADKRVTAALKKREAAWKAEYDKKLEAEKNEAARLAKLSAEEREREVFNKEREAFNKEREQFKRDQLELQVVKNLTEQGLDAGFASLLTGVDAETSNENIKQFKQAWDVAIEKEVNARLAGTPPKASQGSIADNPFSAETFNLTKQAELYRNDPAKYEELKNSTK